jgi:hypothetical protein
VATASPGAWAYLAGQLSASTELAAVVGDRIYREAAPQAVGAATYPLAVCSWASTRSALGVGGVRLVSEPVYLVRCIVADGDQSALAAAAAAIEAALGAGDGLAAPALPTPPALVSFAGQSWLVQSWWEADFERSEFEYCVRYDSAGATYRLFIQPLPEV